MVKRRHDEKEASDTHVPEPFYAHFRATGCVWRRRESAERGERDTAEVRMAAAGAGGLQSRAPRDCKSAEAGVRKRARTARWCARGGSRRRTLRFVAELSLDGHTVLMIVMNSGAIVAVR